MTVRQQVRLSNAARHNEPMTVDALVDPMKTHTRLPISLIEKLGLRKVDTRPTRGANGHLVNADYVGPLTVEAFGRSTCTGAVAIGDAVLLGRIAMDGMDVLIDEAAQRLVPNPAHPIIPGSLAVGVRSAA